MRVLMLGAGASHAAGYPLGQELIDSVEAHVGGRTVEKRVGAYWSYFLAFRDAARDPVRLLMTSANPEVALSFIDICIEALQASDADVRRAERAVLATIRGLPADIDPTGYYAEKGAEIQSIYDRMRESPLHAAVRARRGLLLGLYEFLRHCHYRDKRAEAARSYLRDELEFVGDGDVIVTTNYDTLAERTLLEEGRWSYSDGYGFSVPLVSGPADLPAKYARELPTEILSPSRVRVLKLHGSYGWQSIAETASNRRDRSAIFLESQLFYEMAPTYAGEPVPVRDAREIATTYPMVSPLLAYPSFLKPFGVPEVWEQARVALADAREIRILGASLPRSDLAMRMLLSPIAFRLAKGEVDVSVHDPSSETLARWRELLGPGVAGISRVLGPSTAP